MEGRLPNPHRRFVDTCISVLRYCGVWPLHPSANILLKILHFIFRTFNYVVMAIHLSTVIALAIYHKGDLTILGDIGGWFIGGFMAFLKFLKFTASYNSIIDHIEKVLIPIDILQQSSDRGMVMNIKDCSNQERMELKLFMSSCGFLVLATVFFGLRQKPRLLIKALYPFETDHSPTYEVVSFIQIYSEAYFFGIIIATDGMVVALIRWTTVHFIALTANYKNCNSKLVKRATIVSIKETWNLANQYNASKLTPEDLEINSFVAFEKHESENSVDNFIWRYKTCIKHHQRLLKLTIDVNVTINLLLLLQFSASLTIVCLCGFQIILNLDNTFRLMQFAIFVSIALGELFIFCWYGNEFAHVTNSMTYNQWSSGWENVNDSTNSDKKHKLGNLITITMLQTMHPIEFKAVDLFVLSTATFLSVVKSSYSVLALLMNMNN